MAWGTKRKAADGSTQYLAGYRDPSGRQRSAGTFRKRVEAERAAHAAQIKVGEGTWIDRNAGKVRFIDYVEQSWWPNLQHLELTTKAACRSILDPHFLPYFGQYPISAISPMMVQAWVSTALAGGLSPRSIRKDHTMLHSVFKAAVRDRVIAYNPCEGNTLLKVIILKCKTITPAEFARLLAVLPERHRALVLVGIETGMRWGEIAALRPRHLDLRSQTVTVQETIVEISKKNSPTGDGYSVKPYPKDDMPIVMQAARLRAALDLPR